MWIGGFFSHEFPSKVWPGRNFVACQGKLTPEASALTSITLHGSYRSFAGQAQ